MSRPSACLGVLIPGPGALKIQFTLPPITPQQYELVLKAKKYAAEETARIIHSNKPLNITAISHPQAPDRTLQRHQAIQFMSRVYVGSISFEVREEMLKAAFSNYGLVKSVNMSWDTNTMTHKGFAFVEFDHPEGAGLSIDRMNGIKLGNRQIKVGRPSNMPQDSSILEEINDESENGKTIYIANIRPEFDEHDLLCLMDPFGEIVKSKFHYDEPLRKSYAYIQFKDKADAAEALTADKLDLAGYSLNICKALAPLEPVTNNNHNNASTTSHGNEGKNNSKSARDGNSHNNNNTNNKDNINSDRKDIYDNRDNSGTDNQAQSSLSSEVAMDIESMTPDQRDDQKPLSSLPSAYADC